MIPTIANSGSEREHKWWYGDGNLYALAIFSDENHQERKLWYENGQLMAHESYKDGKREGKRVTWYDNGRLMEDSFYRNGELEGRYKTWHENGYPKELRFYKNGDGDGEYRCFYGNGQMAFSLVERSGAHARDLYIDMRSILLRTKNKLQSEVIKENLIFMKIPLISDLIGTI
jgi:antitoxin component YwqK of YwqJK toxin-antitoxin module